MLGQVKTNVLSNASKREEQQQQQQQQQQQFYPRFMVMQHKKR